MPTVRLLAVTVPRLLLSVTLAMIAACTSAARRLSVDPDVSFAAHRVHAGLMIDAMRGGEPALVRPATWLRLPGEATFVLSGGTAEGEALWIGGPGSVIVRRTRTPDSPIIGTVAPSWDNDAIRIAVAPAERPPYKTDV